MEISLDRRVAGLLAVVGVGGWATATALWFWRPSSDQRCQVCDNDNTNDDDMNDDLINDAPERFYSARTYDLPPLPSSHQTNGKVYLVGAGPGGVGLITVLGQQLLSAAHVVIADELADAELLSSVASNAKVTVVGKRGGKASSVPQETINKLIVDAAKSGSLVVRLKGGDPMVFGRAEPEMTALTKNNIPFEIVPGVTSVLSACSAAGIPVTEKTLSRAFVVVSGHAPANLDWDPISKIDTILILMGTLKLSLISSLLIQHGKPKDTPIAIVHWANTPKQKILLGTLAETCVALNGPSLSPAIIVVGTVAKHATSVTSSISEYS
eukprot:m.256867 g.256867  ORF g.256867 m.256867 type:complete len:325 (-) comp34770_c0_seq1:59-1033(-)